MEDVPFGFCLVRNTLNFTLFTKQFMKQSRLEHPHWAKSMLYFNLIFACPLAIHNDRITLS
jgi:hypothetical protein